VRRCVPVVAVLFASCSASDQTTRASAPAADAQVNERLLQYPDAVRSAVLDSIMGFWTDDVRVLEPEFRAEGAAALRKNGQAFYDRFKITRVAFAPAETYAHDDGAVVYQYGYYTEDFTPKAGGDTINARNNFAARWVKDSSGQWRIHRFIAVPAPLQGAPSGNAAPVAAAADAPPGDAASVEQRLQEYQAAVTAGDAEAVKAFYAEDARSVVPRAELNDKAALAKAFDASLPRNKVRVDVTSEEVFVHDKGTVAYQYGGYTERLERAGRPAVTNRMNFMIRWEKDAAGRWLIDRFYATPTPR
jgi:ketosteroid isomerase-like protein